MTSGVPTPSRGGGSPSPLELFEEALELARLRSLKRREIDWDDLAPQLLRRAAGCVALAEAHDLIRELLTSLHDGHSFLRTPADMEAAGEPHHSGLRLHQAEPVVIDVLPGGAAEHAGFSQGERILAVDGEDVNPENWPRLRRASLRAGVRLARQAPTGSGDSVIETMLPAGFSRRSPSPAGYLASGEIAVVDLPGHDGDGRLGDGRRYDEVLRELLRELQVAGARGWVVDLRRCDGGNMWPLLAGLVPLLGVGRYGAFVDPVASVWHDWGFDGRDLFVTNRSDPAERYTMQRIAEWEPLIPAGAPVAVLQSVVTSSSGEAVLISFLGRERTRTFGQISGGLTTSNNLHVLADGSWLLLAESLEADRLDRIHHGAITPDVPTDIDWQLLGGERDAGVRTATAWLHSRLEGAS